MIRIRRYCTRCLGARKKGKFGVHAQFTHRRRWLDRLSDAGRPMAAVPGACREWNCDRFASGSPAEMLQRLDQTRRRRGRGEGGRGWQPMKCLRVARGWVGRGRIHRGARGERGADRASGTRLGECGVLARSNGPDTATSMDISCIHAEFSGYRGRSGPVRMTPGSESRGTFRGCHASARRVRHAKHAVGHRSTATASARMLPR